jgi:membrane carboxypeptidase/penicillin-binding protein PbpC
MRFFDKNCKELTDAEFLILIANLPGMSDATNRYDRYARILYDKKEITEAEYYSLLQSKPVLTNKAKRVFNPTIFSPLISHYIRENIDHITKDTLNLYLSNLLQDTLENSIRYFMKGLPDTSAVASFALVKADDMSVICYINTNSVKNLEYDLIESPYSLPYSRIKIIIYSLLLNKTKSKPEEILLPLNYSYSKKNFKIKNILTCSLSDALARSINSPAIYTLNELIGLHDFKSVLADNGLVPDSVELYPSAALGTFNISEMNLLNVARVALYNGKVLFPRFTKSCKNYSEQPAVIDSAKCQFIREILQEAIKSGTSKNLRGLDSLNIKIYNKTGSSEYGDAVGCVGLLEINNKYYLYTLRLESSKKIFTVASSFAVPLLNKICKIINIHSFLLD